MILAIAIVLACAVLLFLGPVYFLWLHQAERVYPEPAGDNRKLPFVDVIVPVKNEMEWIATKIENLKVLDYPVAQHKVWIVDGGSTDDTLRQVRSLISGDSRFELREVGSGNKIAQLNATLSSCSGEWVLVTDCDAWLPLDTLRRMIAVAGADGRLGVVGVTVHPRGTLALDALYWRLLNWILLRESRRGFATLVTAPCYLFRRRLFDRFPNNTIADDVHVALAAARHGYRVTVVAAEVLELRAPANVLQLFAHKLRETV